MTATTTQDYTAYFGQKDGGLAPVAIEAANMTEAAAKAAKWYAAWQEHAAAAGLAPDAIYAGPLMLVNETVKVNFTTATGKWVTTGLNALKDVDPAPATAWTVQNEGTAGEVWVQA
jgi:hypothetical protein